MHASSWHVSSMSVVVPTMLLSGEQLLTAWLHVHGVLRAGSAGVLSEGAARELLAKMQTLPACLHSDVSRY